MTNVVNMKDYEHLRRKKVEQPTFQLVDDGELWFDIPSECPDAPHIVKQEETCTNQNR